ncbi:MAG: GNAT family N-acetyltransferase, partial [Ruminococcaceae bacterium]|nr:GNAT family N-acetyltransferase [Oscillospiraceae bacterium]
MVREISDKNEKKRIAREILEALPEWFGIPESREEYITQSAEQLFFAAEEDGETVGFL